MDNAIVWLASASHPQAFFTPTGISLSDLYSKLIVIPFLNWLLAGAEQVENVVTVSMVPDIITEYNRIVDTMFAKVIHIIFFDRLCVCEQ